MMDAGRWQIAAAIGLILVVGFARLAREARRLVARQEEVSEFFQTLHQYINSKGQDAASYSLLLERSPRVQELLGHFGMFASFRKPFAPAFRQYAVVLNMLPELRRSFQEDQHALAPRQEWVEYGSLLQESLLRAQGAAKDELKNVHSALVNPFVWFREGVRAVLLGPIALLLWLGVLPADSPYRVARSRVFRIVSGLVALISLVSSIIGIALGWREARALLSSLWN